MTANERSSLTLHRETKMQGLEEIAAAFGDKVAMGDEPKTAEQPAVELREGQGRTEV